MRTMKVFVLVKFGEDNLSNHFMEVVGVYSTKTAAKEKMKEEKERTRNYFFEDPNGYECEKDDCEEYGECKEVWGISCNDYPIFTELNIIEKEVTR